MVICFPAEIEMRQLKARLMETEAQMSRILKAMETVSDKVVPKVLCLCSENRFGRENNILQVICTFFSPRKSSILYFIKKIN